VEAGAIYGWLKSSEEGVGVFDERYFFLGESAFLAGAGARLIGQRQEAARWLERAEASFRNTVNPGPNLANVAYARMALKFEMGEHEDVLELVPELRSTFEQFGMQLESAKCSLLEAMALKGKGNTSAALALLNPICKWSEDAIDTGLRGRIFAEIGDLHQIEDRFDDAMVAYSSALSLLDKGGRSQARADLKAFVGEAYRTRGQLGVALDSFRAAIEDYQQLGLTTRVAYLHLFIADTLIGLSRHREAEWEILAALPTIEEQKMVPEGFAAVALLKESVRRRKTDPNALRELREHLQASR
jgi:tetratricopeptide (TPR) repeat protein